MNDLHPGISMRRLPLRLALLLSVWLGALDVASIHRLDAQEADTPTIKLTEVQISGVRRTATNRWTTCYFSVSNYTDQDRLARVVVAFAQQRDAQYGRDIWVPARARITSWILVGPQDVPEPKEPKKNTKKPAEEGAEFQYVLYDLTDGKETLVQSRDEQKLETRTVRVRGPEPSTTLMGDALTTSEWDYAKPPQIGTPTDEYYVWARTLRRSRGLTPIVTTLGTRALPTSPEALEGTDHFVLATNRISNDLPGLRAIRQWVEQGGSLVVMLDKVQPETLALLLGSAYDFHIIDRTSLSNFHITERRPNGMPDQLPKQTYEQPISLVRVVLPEGEHAKYSVNGWPIHFQRKLGRGRVFVVALGPRGWYDTKDPTKPKDPTARAPLEDLAVKVLETWRPNAERLNEVHPVLTEQIGYSVVPRTTVIWIFGVALGLVLLLALVVRKSRHPEWVGWLGPLAALTVAGVFVFLAEKSRRTIPPTVAVLQIVDGVSGAEEAPAYGVLAVYRQESGPAELAAIRGGLFEIDLAGVQGQIHRRIRTDLDAWHWDGLALPAGVRFAEFQDAVPMEEPLEAIATFGPDGLEGTLRAKPFTGFSDAVLESAYGRKLAIAVEPDGRFSATSADLLVGDQLLTGTVLSDRQQRRKKLFPLFARQPKALRKATNNVLYVWADPVDLGYRFASDAKLVGNALLRMPLRLRAPPPGQSVTIPSSLIVPQRVAGVGTISLAPDGTLAADMHLRFQVPEEVLPFRVERARLRIEIDAPQRRIIVSTQPKEGSAVPPEVLVEVESPIDPIELDLEEPDTLYLDSEGGLHLRMKIGERMATGSDDTRPDSRIDRWQLGRIELEVVGQVIAQE